MGHKPRIRPLSFLLYPSIENVRVGDFGDREYEDFLWVCVEFESDLSKRKSTAFRKIHQKWQERLEEEACAIGEEEGMGSEEKCSLRFGGLFLKGRSARFGAAYFVSAANTMTWLVIALHAFGGVKTVTIGEAPEPECDEVERYCQENGQWDPPMDFLSDLTLWEEGARICAPTFSIWLYTDKLLSTIPDEILACWNAFKKLVPQERLRWWATETSRKHKKVGKAALRKLEDWLAPDAPPREYLSIQLHDGEDFNWAPTTEFGVFGEEKGDNAKLVHLTFPASWAFSQSAMIREFVLSLANTFPFFSGHAGISIRTSPYFRDQSEKHAWSQSMARPSIDVQSVVGHSFAAGKDGVRTLAWMTLVGDALLDRVGGLPEVRRQLPEGVEVDSVLGGVVFTIGEIPQLISGNDKRGMAPYRALHRSLQPLVDSCLPRSKWLSTPNPQEANNALWWSRFEHWPEIELSRDAIAIRFDKSKPHEVLPFLKSKVSTSIDRIHCMLADTQHPPGRPERSEMGRVALESSLTSIFRSISFISHDLLDMGEREVALKVMVFALALPRPPASLFASLSRRQYSAYVFKGAIPLFLDAGDVDSAVRHSDQALLRAEEEPDIYFCAARAYIRSNQQERAFEVIGLAREMGYKEMRGIREDDSFASVAKSAAFQAACGCSAS